MGRGERFGGSGMTTDTRPPLHLTAGEAARWMSLHPEDQGREIVIVETHIRPCPKKIVRAHKGFGRWEQGFTGRWPRYTAFALSFLEHPPAWAFIDCGMVTLRLAGEERTYALNRADRWELVGS